MTAAKNEKANRAGLAPSENKLNADFEPGSAPAQPKKDIDLLSWSKLGSNAKPSRDRRQKRGWKRGAR